MPSATSRRNVLRLACACACSSLAQRATPAFAATPPPLSRACLLTPAGSRVYQSRGFLTTSVADVFRQGRNTTSTGNTDIDRELGRAIKITADILRVNPAFSFFEPDRFVGDSEAEWMNAFADGNTYVPGTTGTVAFGMTNFRSELFGYDESGTSVMTIIAHEFGHIVQVTRGYIGAIDYGVPCGVEINADFLAGYYLGIRARTVSSLRFERAEDWFVRAGNPRPDRRHGNSDERVRAGRAGYEVGIAGRALDDAIRAGWDYFGFHPER
jgi:hypothetical protein